MQEERDICGLRVTARQLPPMRAYRLLARLGKLAGPLARALTPDALARIKAGDFAAAIPVALAVFTEMDEASAEGLALATLACAAVTTQADGGQPRVLQLTDGAKIDAAFAGNLRAMLGAMLLALEVNYRDFFADRGQAATTTPTQSP